MADRRQTVWRPLCTMVSRSAAAHRCRASRALCRAGGAAGALVHVLTVRHGSALGSGLGGLVAAGLAAGGLAAGRPRDNGLGSGLGPVARSMSSVCCDLGAVLVVDVSMISRRRSPTSICATRKKSGVE
eukprot:6592666-Prymnesium_polylepis.1